ncbi:hypothetical protein Kpol_1053p44 [Vanderwaltozyma polyspora DSM 70294]|uniref:RNA exonuclease 4 n=1 Tax=Vanderwaltozyma polyspora (strain ATCC 22028 / DSM 70294 / BCRC 21397 / CBS 2163 / NBRC 10782 / NRRL Y-8283 / UCD 57-17) TaxID=436907 RepID=A7TN88_VANPO|nr:uncharacterized protein Kpol_1053p44 [Vanderwaltozyma polyspora DSM 70294]EDO16306.1 hypothetical protein Kpol_1053p44 [Vanderwaltozyma polyspora DSM 70294]
MALSSNWENLKKSKRVVVKEGKKKNNGKAVKNDGKITKNEAEKMKKPRKIMDMIYNMNKEMKKAKEEKMLGNDFEFNKEIGNSKLDEKLMDDIKLVNHNEKVSNTGKYVAIDCEFVGVGPDAKESALARISVVNYFGHVILDEYVRPQEKVTDWRTWVSGIKPEHMKSAITFIEAQKRASEILNGRILVGHSVKHDLEALLVSHPKSMIRDTSRHLPFRQKYAKGKTVSLKKLAKEILNVEIQDGRHSSVEDARSTMLIYKSDKLEFEKLHKNHNNSTH